MEGACMMEEEKDLEVEEEYCGDCGELIDDCRCDELEEDDEEDNH
jgi:hypothetical protein